MPDSLPPPGWGLAPFDERDLDAVLAGKTADVPVALRPVADVLAALRAGPAPAELHGEADAMAEFRALGLGQAGRPAPTMPLEALPVGSRARPGRRQARHRVRPARRHPLRRAVLRPAVLSAVAAAAVIVAAVLVTGNVVGPFRVIAHMASPSAGARSSTSTTEHSTAPGVEATSAGRDPTTPPAVTHSAVPAPPTPSEICQAYFTGLRNLGPSPWATNQTLLGQLTKLAGSDNWLKVYQYCLSYVKELSTDAQWPGHPGPENQNNGDLGQQAGAPADSGNGSGSGTVSNGPASTGPTSNAKAGNGQGDPPGGGSNP